MRIPSARLKFQQLVESQVTGYGLPQKINELYEHIAEGLHFTDEQSNLYNSIELRMQQAVKYADNCCRKACHGQLPYSPMQKKLMGSIFNPTST